MDEWHFQQDYCQFEDFHLLDKPLGYPNVSGNNRTWYNVEKYILNLFQIFYGLKCFLSFT